jgi:putative membrane-bound dehydrogenase-like protein
MLVLLLMALAQDRPLTAEEEQATFKLPPGYTIELVAADPDALKIVDIAFDDAGRMWAVTASEYPLDGNEDPRAAELYRNGGKDRVLVFDTPTAPGRQKPRVFASGLAMPMAVLPYKDGAIVGQGPDIFFLREDGRREVLLSGFGIQDSHLMPHRFVRGPGGWIYMAQGAFNYSNVRSRDGTVVEFNQCKVGRFKPDGSRFEIAGWGLNNIWGFVLDRQGEMFVQEANDLGYPVVPFFIGASYPGIGMHRARPYSRWQPPLAKFSMGGTGLSGLALSEDPGGFPAPHDGVFFVANPITSKIQAIRVHRDGPRHRIEKLPDFIETSDGMFRPVAIHFGPDGGLYVVDWYNKIIQHNEAPRNHPDRDKVRTRVWRIRHASMTRREIPNVAAAPDDALIDHLLSDSTWRARAAWHQIVDRPARSLAPKLLEIATSDRPVHQRILALWSAEGLDGLSVETLGELLKDPNRAVRREAARAVKGMDAHDALGLLATSREEEDPQVRFEVIRSLGSYGDRGIAMLMRMIRSPMDGLKIKPQQAEEPVFAAGPAAEREFERELARRSLERASPHLAAWLSSEAADEVSPEGLALAALAVGGPQGAKRLAGIVDRLKREPIDEELLLLAGHVPASLAPMLGDPNARRRVLGVVGRSGIKPADAGPFIEAARQEGSEELIVRLATAWRLTELQPQLAAIAGRAGPQRLAALRALADLESFPATLFTSIAADAKAADDARREAVRALAGRADMTALRELWPILPAILRRVAIDRLTESPAGAAALLGAIQDDDVSRDELTGRDLERLKAVAGDDEEVVELLKNVASRMGRVLRLNGKNEDYVDTNITLGGAFTVEAWVRLDPGISNEDGILGAPGSADFNFYDRRFRAYVGEPEHDAIIAERQIEPETWTHVAITRDPQGMFKLYLNGTLDNDRGKRCTRAFANLDVGRTIPAAGTAGMIAEMRIWNVERTAVEILESFDRSFHGEPRPAGLAHLFAGEGPWGKLNGGARIEATPDLPPLMSAEQARQAREETDRIRALAAKPGDAARGRDVYVKTCAVCHRVKGEGGQIGPNLDGAGAKRPEELLRSILTPGAAVESGYRVLRVETRDRELLEGFMASQDAEGIVLRRPNQPDLPIPRAQIRRSTFLRQSLMPEGLLKDLTPDDVAALFAYLRTLQ